MNNSDCLRDLAAQGRVARTLRSRNFRVYSKRGAYDRGNRFQRESDGQGLIIRRCVKGGATLEATSAKTVIPETDEDAD